MLTRFNDREVEYEIQFGHELKECSIQGGYYLDTGIDLTDGELDELTSQEMATIDDEHRERQIGVAEALMDRDGFTLLEVLIATMLMGILLAASSSMLVKLASASKKYGPAARVISISSTCVALDGGYFGNAQGADTLQIYKAADCASQYIGSLGRLTNETWFNEETRSLWLTFSNAQLKLLVVRY